jgi:hypothetical protein
MTTKIFRNSWCVKCLMQVTCKLQLKNLQVKLSQTAAELPLFGTPTDYLAGFT